MDMKNRNPRTRKSICRLATSRPELDGQERTWNISKRESWKVLQREGLVGRLRKQVGEMIYTQSCSVGGSEWWIPMTILCSLLSWTENFFSTVFLLLRMFRILTQSFHMCLPILLVVNIDELYPNPWREVRAGSRRVLTGTVDSILYVTLLSMCGQLTWILKGRKKGSWESRSIEKRWHLRGISTSQRKRTRLIPGLMEIYKVYWIASLA